MINSEQDIPGGAPAQDEAVDRILLGGAKGAVVLAGIATAIVIAIWFAFYLFVFVPRATAP
ncbi:MAG: hypothetical protein PW843_11350 [Azospirillaceae bacterium]|nr:hypothetical protein [Azospirillaceae bacterium]